jgi:hypothetical protein
MLCNSSSPAKCNFKQTCRGTLKVAPLSWTFMPQPASHQPRATWILWCHLQPSRAGRCSQGGNKWNCGTSRDKWRERCQGDHGRTHGPWSVTFSRLCQCWDLKEDVDSQCFGSYVCLSVCLSVIVICPQTEHTNLARLGLCFLYTWLLARPHNILPRRGGHSDIDQWAGRGQAGNG